MVKTEFLEDSIEKTWKYSDNYERVTVPVHAKGDIVTEVFGPYIDSSHNQNYSQYNTYRRVPTDEPQYKRSHFQHLTDEQWERGAYSKVMKATYVQVCKQDVSREKLTPVFALNGNGTLTLELDWVSYDR